MMARQHIWFGVRRTGDPEDRFVLFSLPTSDSKEGMS